MRSRRVLVIEDNPISQRLLRMILAREHITVVEALDGKAALACAAEAIPDLVLLDLGLPDVDGLDLLRRFRELPGGATVPVIAVSGYVARLEHARLGGAGFVDILTKPVDPELVVRMVETYLPRSDPGPLTGEGRKILAIDDDPMQLRLLARSLERLGFVVTMVGESAKALEEARRAPPDAVVSDVLMPQPDGFRLCRLIRQDPKLAKVPVVLSTSAYIEAADRQLAASVGASALVVRTPGFEGIAEALEAALASNVPLALSSAGGALEESYERRSLHQLERRAALTVELGRRCSLQAAQLSVLTATSESLARRATPDLGVVLEQCLEAGGASAGAIFEVEGTTLALRAHVGLAETQRAHLEQWLGENLEQTFRGEAAPPFGPTAGTADPRRDVLARIGAGRLIALPLVSWNERVGVLALASPSRALEREDWLAFVRNIAAQIGQAIALARAFARVQKSDERFRRLADSMPQIVWTTRPDGTADYFNERWYEFSGLPQGNDAATAWQSVIHPEDLARVVETSQRSRETGAPWELEYRLKASRDQAYRWHLGRSLAVRDDAGAIAHWFATATDIDDRKRVEKAHLESEEMLRQVAESIDEVFWLTDPELSRMLYVSSAYERLWMRSCMSLYERPRSFIDAIHEDDRARVVEAIRHDFPQGKHEATFRVVRPDGSQRWARSRAFAVRGSSGVILRMAGVVTDITELKLAAELAAITAEVAFAVTDTQDIGEAMRRCTDAVVQHLDVALARIWRATEKPGGLDLAASSGLEAGLDPSRPHGAKFSLERIAGLREPYLTNELATDPHVDREWARREGLTSFAGYPMAIDGALVGVVAIFSRSPLDERSLETLRAAAHVIALALRRKAEEREKELLAAQFRQAQKMEAVGRLAGGVAHDFNNLLTVIMGHSELLLSQLRRDDPLRLGLEEIRTAGSRAASLTHQLLVFSRHQVLETKVLDLNAIVSDMDRMLRRLIGEDLELKVALDPRAGQIKADAGQIEQVILNLSVNARDAMPRGGRLTIATSNAELDENGNGLLRGSVKAGAYVLLEVSDTGTGMTEEVLSHLFEPFFTTKESGKGTGLGLSSVFGIAKTAGGHVSVSSELGTGTTFRVYFPRVNGTVESAVPNTETRPRGGSETILLVEDDELVRKLSHQILEMSGYDVIATSNGGEALLACERHEGPIHLVLTDVVMPKMSGKELVERLAKVRPDLTVLYCSGYTSGVVLHDDVIGSGSAFIQKPFTPKSLARKVREVLDSKA